MKDCYARLKLFDVIYRAVYANYRVHMDQVLTEAGYVPEGEKLENKHAINIFFGNYMEPDADPKIYDQVTRIKRYLVNVFWLMMMN